MQATRCWPFFKGTISVPTVKDPSKISEAEKKEIKVWEHNDLAARYLLSQHLPDSVTVRLQAYNTVKSRWDHLVSEFTAQSVYAQNDLEQVFFNMWCPKGGDVCAFLTALCYKKEELAAAGVTVTQKEYQCTVLKSIPNELAKFASQLLTTVRITSHVVDTETLINSICEESKWLKNRHVRNQQGQGGSKKDGQANEALAATGSEGGR